jgi:hypothetical protein
VSTLQLPIFPLNRNPLKSASFHDIKTFDIKTFDSSIHPMSTVHLQVRSSDGTSKSFVLTEHDNFLLGRMVDCHLRVPADPQVSRHHFLSHRVPSTRSSTPAGKRLMREASQ